jgi:hypothetical protein
MNDKLQMTCDEAVVSESRYYPNIRLEGLSKTTKNISQLGHRLRLKPSPSRGQRSSWLSTPPHVVGRGPSNWFITAFTRARHWTLRAKPNPVHPPPTVSLTSVLILPSPRLGLPSGLFRSAFQTKTMYASHRSRACHMPSPPLILLDLVILYVRIAQSV